MERIENSSLLKKRILIFLVPLFLSLPFINRAYFVDDNYFVEIATWLTSHPLEPYDFRADDAGLQNRGWEEDGFVRMVNPLLHHYYLAVLLKIGGAHEWFLRLGCVLLSCFSGFFIFELARRWMRYPFLSTLLVLVTPVHWLTAHSLLIDSTMGFLFLGGLLFFIQAGERDSIPLYALSGVFMGLALLAKYTALLILPLTGVWWILNWRALRRKQAVFLPWAIALSFLLFYSAITAHLYGRPHILAASARMVHKFGWAKVYSFFVFFSGASLVPLLAWSLLGLRRALVVGCSVVLLALFFFSPMGGFSLVQGFLLGLWFVTSLVVIGAFLEQARQWRFPQDTFLFLWVISFIAMMMAVMDWVAVRYYVIVTPALVLMTARMIEMKWPKTASRVLRVSILLTALLTAAIGYADYKQASSSRFLVSDLKAKGFQGGARHFYLGDSFTMSYLKKEGWAACFPNTTFQIGDRIIGNEVTMPLKWFSKRPVVLKELATFEYSTRFPIKVMDYQGSAGFYASVWGALPFTIHEGPWERFHLFEVVDFRPEAAPSAGTPPSASAAR